jgi:hypothetical protein
MPCDQGGWKVLKGQIPESHFPFKKDAMREAQSIAKNQDGIVLFHDSSGHIKSTNLYGERAHVVPHLGKWTVKLESTGPIGLEFDAKHKAIDTALEVAKGHPIVVHGKQGQIISLRKTKSSLSDKRIRLAVRKVSGHLTR